MLKGLYGWVKTIAACLIFMSLILRLLPESKNLKYIRYFMGMVLVFIVLAPLGRLFHLEESFSRLERSFERAGARADFEDELALMGDAYTEEVVKGYEEELADQVSVFLEEAGYGECPVRVTIGTDPDRDTFGQIESLQVLFSQKAEEGNETGRIVIEKKKVQILSEEPMEKSYLEEAEDHELKRALSEEFSIPEEMIGMVR